MRKLNNKGNAGVGAVGGIALIIIILIALFGVIVCTVKVPVGYKAIVYSMNNGVQGETLDQGWHLLAPTKKVKMFTISNEQMLLTKDKREGSKENESFKVSTSDDASIAISFQMSYRFNEENLVETYKKFKGMDGDDIINNRVRTVLKSRISEITTNYSMMDIYSGNRSEINTKITEYLNEKFFEEYGIEVIDCSIVDVHPDKQLQKTIDARVEAVQNKQKAQAEQETVRVEAETAKIKAENEAAIKLLEAQAEADANALLEQSLTDKVLTQMMLEKWDGKLPTVTSGDKTILDVSDLIGESK